jgi:hypothetical protein
MRLTLVVHGLAENVAAANAHPRDGPLLVHSSRAGRNRLDSELETVTNLNKPCKKKKNKKKNIHPGTCLLWTALWRTRLRTRCMRSSVAPSVVEGELAAMSPRRTTFLTMLLPSRSWRLCTVTGSLGRWQYLSQSKSPKAKLEQC